MKVDTVPIREDYPQRAHERAERMSAMIEMKGSTRQLLARALIKGLDGLNQELPQGDVNGSK